MNATAPILDSAKPIDIVLPIEGMTCASCVNRIERFLNKTDGVLEASVNLATERATVTVDPTLVGRAGGRRRGRGGGVRRPSRARLGRAMLD